MSNQPRFGGALLVAQHAAGNVERGAANKGTIIMPEMFSLGLIYNAFKDLVKLCLGIRKPQFSPEEKIALRDKWKPVFEEWLLDRRRSRYGSDVIIRDVRRFDKYPDTDPKKKGISSWFRLGLMDTYHGGILVGLRWERLVEVPEGSYRVARMEDHANGNDLGIKVILAGRIPYHQIQSVDFGGDEYYTFPHIFCHFSLRGQPYESVEFYEQRQLEDFDKPYFVQIGKYRNIRKESTNAGIKHV
ncbi:hypothetical protein [Paracoccus marinaquae]|uniref:Uncharacterized protein n=1 Tax=Paracoccus marinaquae TaxID=2841926 RepID=A0ABS6AJR7_9RHOB|nr:hypothetical protein [Paracoccus marinaquae]MBU3029874.1 hypothetical protein [Paracoccus marinaquae]